jgi:hypothetical protein
MNIPIIAMSRGPEEDAKVSSGIITGGGFPAGTQIAHLGIFPKWEFSGYGERERYCPTGVAPTANLASKHDGKTQDFDLRTDGV